MDIFVENISNFWDEVPCTVINKHQFSEKLKSLYLESGLRRVTYA
jgi:hypothetical protein